jgi:hypothetical protein
LRAGVRFDRFALLYASRHVPLQNLAVDITRRTTSAPQWGHFIGDYWANTAVKSAMGDGGDSVDATVRLATLLGPDTFP